MQLLLEAPITKKYADLMIKRGNQATVFYNKKWIKIEPVKIVDKDGALSLVAFQVGGPDELQSYEFDKITNWNLLSNIKATKADNEKKREKKEKKPAAIAPAITKPGGAGTLSDKIKDAINNKRVVNVFYKGDKEEPAGWRNKVEPHFYGKAGKPVRGVTVGQNYVRVWVGDGKSVSAEKKRGNDLLSAEEKTSKNLPQWRFFREDRIDKWEVEGEKTFNKPPASNFNPTGDKRLEKCTCISDFAPDKASDDKISDDKASDALLESKLLPGIINAINIF